MSETSRVFYIMGKSYNTNKGLWVYFTDHSCFEAKGIIPLYIYADDATRLDRAIKREQQQINTDYKEVCRRYLADEEDFSVENLERCRISNRFQNDFAVEDCFSRIKHFVESIWNGDSSIC